MTGKRRQKQNNIIPLLNRRESEKRVTRDFGYTTRLFRRMRLKQPHAQTKEGMLHKAKGNYCSSCG